MIHFLCRHKGGREAEEERSNYLHGYDVMWLDFPSQDRHSMLPTWQHYIVVECMLAQTVHSTTSARQFTNESNAPPPPRVLYNSEPKRTYNHIRQQQQPASPAIGHEAAVNGCLAPSVFVSVLNYPAAVSRMHFPATRLWIACDSYTATNGRRTIVRE